MRRTIKETIRNISYENGTRVEVVEKVISRADDCAKVGELYFRMSDLYRRLENNEINADEREVIAKELDEVKDQIWTYTGYLDGYGK